MVQFRLEIVLSDVDPNRQVPKHPVKRTLSFIIYGSSEIGDRGLICLLKEVIGEVITMILTSAFVGMNVLLFEERGIGKIDLNFLALASGNAMKYPKRTG